MDDIPGNETVLAERRPDRLAPIVVGDDINLQELFRGVVRDWSLILVITLISAAAGIWYAYWTPPIYEGQALLAPVIPDDNSPGSSIAGELASSLATVPLFRPKQGVSAKDRALAFFKSRSFTEHFITQQNLMPELFRKRWNSETKTWKADGSRSPTMDDAVRQFFRIRNILVDDATGLVTVTVRWDDPERAAQLTNLLVAAANEDLRQQALDEAAYTLQHTQVQLNKTTAAEVRATLAQIVETQVKLISLAETRPQFAFKVIDPAEPPGNLYFVSPRRLLVISVSVAAGLALSMTFSIFKTVLRDGKTGHQDRITEQNWGI